MLDMNQFISNAALQIYTSDIHVRHHMRIQNRVFPFYVMSYIQQGEAELRVRERAYHLEPGSAILIPPDTEHDHIKVGDEPTVFMWWHFDYKVYDAFDLLRLLRLPLLFTLDASNAFENAFAEYMKITESPVDLKNTILKKAGAMTVLAYLLGAAQQEGARRVAGVPECFQEMLDTILACREPGLSLRVFSQRFHMNPTYLSNRFKHFYGEAPISLHRRILLRRAKDMLAVQGMSVTEVAEALGFDSASVFSRFFSSKIGQPPSKMIREESVQPLS